MRQLHREFLRAGANVMQTFTFYASDDKLENRGNKLTHTVSSMGRHTYIGTGRTSKTKKKQQLR